MHAFQQAQHLPSDAQRCTPREPRPPPRGRPPEVFERWSEEVHHQDVALLPCDRLRTDDQCQGGGRGGRCIGGCSVAALRWPAPGQRTRTRPARSTPWRTRVSPAVSPHARVSCVVFQVPSLAFRVSGFGFWGSGLRSEGGSDLAPEILRLRYADHSPEMLKREEFSPQRLPPPCRCRCNLSPCSSQRKY